MSTNKKYAVIDLETTGGKAEREKITEIGIVITDGEKVLDTFESLINPERSIPPNITRLTGISDAMVKTAPKFYEVAKKIVEITEDCIFVAHNVRFDYSFLKCEFARLGFTYTKKQLCTVRLTRKTFPNLKSYGLSNLIHHFDLPLVGDRHRAMADAFATAKLLSINLENFLGNDLAEKLINKQVKNSLLPLAISMDDLHALPEECGVYYFYDENKNVVYIGKSINIQKRVMQHFSKTTTKSQKLASFVHSIDYELTGSELVALLKESDEIKTMSPSVNRAQRVKQYPYIIHQYENMNGYMCWDVTRNSKKAQESLAIISEFPTLLSAKTAIKRAIENNNLCAKYCNLDKAITFCFNYHIKKCNGACGKIESPEDYNKKVETAKETITTFFCNDMLIVDKGRSSDENSAILVQNGKCVAYGWINNDLINNSIPEIINSLPQKTPYPDSTKIIKGFIARNPQLKVISLNESHFL